MKDTLYLECYSGISGDMMVASLLDLGADEKVLRDVLSSLPLEGYEIRISRVKKSGIDCMDFDVSLEEDNHDHDMEYLYGHVHEHSEHHEHGDSHEHSEHHECGGSHEHLEHHEHSHHHTHQHRGMKEVTDIINAGSMTEYAKLLALKIFHILAVAEAKAHNVDYEEVHFHEVGATDSIVDIVSVAVCLDNLGIKDVIVPGLYEGVGTVRCAHGILPVPVPAVANIIQQHEIPLCIRNVQGEYITPTGAAVVAAIMTKKTLPKHFNIHKIGIGAGKRVYDGPGFLRGMLIEETDYDK